MDRPRIKSGVLQCLNWRPFVLIAVLLFGCEIPPPIVPVPDPINPPGPVVVVPGLRVLIVRETSDTNKLPPTQNLIFTSAPFRAFIHDAKATLKVWDDEVDTANETDAEFRKMLELPRSSLPWIVIAGGSKTVSQPLPGTVAETQALIAGAK